MIMILKSNNILTETITSITIVAMTPLIINSTLHSTRKDTIAVTPSPKRDIYLRSFLITVLESLLSHRPLGAFFGWLLTVLI